jgi:hypothetical protein
MHLSQRVGRGGVPIRGQTLLGSDWSYFWALWVEQSLDMALAMS